MKRITLIIFLALAAYAAQAQTIYDALLFSERNYEGTARSVAMGNAFTALGGDLGSIVLNPAGSAVAGYSQFSITPSLSFTANTTHGVLPPDNNGILPYFEKTYRNRTTGFSIPNFGLTLNYETGRKSGLKSVTFGFITSQTNNWDEDVYAAGTNRETSFMGAMAYEATMNGLYGSNLNMNNAYDYDPWKYVVGYQSGMISTFGGHDDAFVGVSEVIFDNDGNTEIALGGPIKQTYGKRVRGKKNDYLFNLGFNISDFVYLGANLGLTSMYYSYNDYFREEADDPSNFEIHLDNGGTLYFEQMKYKYTYDVETTGVYGKFGIIVTPGFGLRFGAAIQTPTASTIEESWQMKGSTSYTDNSYNASADSPVGDDRYSFSEPWRANFGIAYTLGKIAAFSVDYEMCDYRCMKFKSGTFDDSRDYFDGLNDDIRQTFGKSKMLRAGVEVKPFDLLAIRAGYGMTTSPQVGVPASQNVSFGLGFISKKSFYADIACRYAFATDEYIMPYDDYIFDANDNVIAYVPEILNRKDAWKVLLTFGWRF